MRRESESEREKRERGETKAKPFFFPNSLLLRATHFAALALFLERGACMEVVGIVSDQEEGLWKREHSLPRERRLAEVTRKKKEGWGGEILALPIPRRRGLPSLRARFSGRTKDSWRPARCCCLA